MHLLLLLLAAVLAAAGAAMLRYAVPVEDVAGAALFTSGVVAVVGALVLAALAAAVRSLARIAERLNIQPLPLPPIAAVGREDPAPRPVRTAPPAPSAARSSLLGWLTRGAPAPTPATRATPPLKAEAEPATPPVDLAPLARLPDAAPPPLPPPPLRPAPKPAPSGPTATVYRSGVIDGMAYSLFMDGSIEAELPTGKVRFATIDELQEYLVSKRA